MLDVIMRVCYFREQIKKKMILNYPANKYNQLGEASVMCDLMCTKQ